MSYPINGSKPSTLRRWLTQLCACIAIVAVSVEVALLLLSVVWWEDLMTLSLSEWDPAARFVLIVWAVFVGWAVDHAYDSIDLARENADADPNT